MSPIDIKRGYSVFSSSNRKSRSKYVGMKPVLVVVKSSSEFSQIGSTATVGNSSFFAKCFSSRGAARSLTCLQHDEKASMSSIRTSLMM